jgi:hypothetical protein
VKKVFLPAAAGLALALSAALPAQTITGQVCAEEEPLQVIVVDHLEKPSANWGRRDLRKRVFLVTRRVTIRFMG